MAASGVTRPSTPFCARTLGGLRSTRRKRRPVCTEHSLDGGLVSHSSHLCRSGPTFPLPCLVGAYLDLTVDARAAPRLQRGPRNRGTLPSGGWSCALQVRAGLPRPGRSGCRAPSSCRVGLSLSPSPGGPRGSRSVCSRGLPAPSTPTLAPQTGSCHSITHLFVRLFAHSRWGAAGAGGRKHPGIRRTEPGSGLWDQHAGRQATLRPPTTTCQGAGPHAWG